MVYLGSAVVQNITVEEPNNSSIEISGLLHGTAYRVTMAGINTRGIGAYSMFVQNTTYAGNKDIIDN